MRNFYYFIIVSIFICSSLSAQLSGGGDLNPDLYPPIQAQNKWQDLKVGLSIHWGPSSLGGKEISWSRSVQIPKDIYDNYYKQFKPNKFDADEWCKLMNKWGVKYIAPTAKHHDGFALWFSQYSEYDMENAGLKIDIMKELYKACKKHNIVLGAYYSNLDWYHPDWFPYNYGGPGKLFEKHTDSPDLTRYFKYFENQVIELIENYDIEFLQFDGEWDSTYTHETGSHLYRVFHNVKPDILLSSRIDIGRRAFGGCDNHLHIDGTKYAGDYQERERVVNYGNNVIAWADHPWQAWVTIDKKQWSYNPEPDLMTAQELICDLVSVIGSNGNYMINLGPLPDGSFDPEQVALMDTLGIWLNEHKKAVYGTRGGPYYPFKEGVSTRKGKKAWVFILDNYCKDLKLPLLTQKLVSAKDFHSKKNIPFQVNTKDNVVELNISDKKSIVRVLELTFDAPVEMQSNKKNTQKKESILDRNEYSITFNKNTVIFTLNQTKKIQAFFSQALNNRKFKVFASSDGINWKEYNYTSDNSSKGKIWLKQSSMGAELFGVESSFFKIIFEDINKNEIKNSNFNLFINE